MSDQSFNIRFFRVIWRESGNDNLNWSTVLEFHATDNPNGLAVKRRYASHNPKASNIAKKKIYIYIYYIMYMYIYIHIFTYMCINIFIIYVHIPGMFVLCVWFSLSKPPKLTIPVRPGQTSRRIDLPIVLTGENDFFLENVGKMSDG